MVEKETEDWATKELSALDVGDKRLDKRAVTILRRFGDQPGASIPQASKGAAELKAAYRWLSNERVGPHDVIGAHSQATLDRIAGEEVVLCIEDTSEIDYSGLGDAGGLGVLNYKSRKGLYLHPMIALTPTDGLMHGTLRYNSVIRENIGKKNSKRPIEEKESYRWLEGYAHVNYLATQNPDTEFIYVADREADIFELLVETKDQKAGFVTRSNHDRILPSGERLSEFLSSVESLGTIEFDLPNSSRHKGRHVTQRVKTQRITLEPPPNLKNSGAIELTVVIAEEIDSPPGVKNPIKWILFTNKEVNSLTQATTIIDYYRRRWQIEIFFKILKSGCQIEQLQLEEIVSLELAISLYMIVAWRVLYLSIIARSVPEISCEAVLETDEWEAAYIVANSEAPPKNPPALGEMIKIIATFGGYTNRKSDGPPGPKTIWIGLQRVQDFAAGIAYQKRIAETT